MDFLTSWTDVQYGSLSWMRWILFNITFPHVPFAFFFFLSCFIPESLKFAIDCNNTTLRMESIESWVALLVGEGGFVVQELQT